MKYLTVICCLALAVVLISCDDDCFKKDINDCSHNNMLPDSFTIRSSIVGQWEWLGRDGIYSDEPCFKADHEVIITFTESNEYSEVEDGLIISQGTWEVINEPNAGWLLEFNSSINYLHDVVRFCEDYVFFEPSHILDTGYNVFRKID